MVFRTYMDKLKSVETHNYTQFDERASKHCADIILKAKEVKVATDDESINQG
jgi:fibrillarin-like rRNA methylase